MSAPANDAVAPTGTLCVSIELNALVVSAAQAQVAALATRFELKETPSLAWLGRNAEPTPFTHGAPLARGVHLHWLLPPALRRSQLQYAVDGAAFDQLLPSAAGRPGGGHGLHHQPQQVLEALRSASAPSRAQLQQLLQNQLRAAGVHGPSAHTVAAQLAQAARSLNAFPAVPNRWMVNRWVGANMKADPISWIVESDRLWNPTRLPWHDTCAEQNKLSPTVLNLPPFEHVEKTITDSSVLHSQLGMVGPAQGWKEFEGHEPWAATDPPPRLTPFTALGWGHPMFAAALPHAYNVFGIWDPLDGVADDAEVAYTVVGWYSNAARDTANQAASWGWTKADAPVPARLLLRGELAHIACGTSASASTNAAGRAVVEPHAIVAAIGATTAQALSAALAQLDTQQGKAGLENTLNVMQLGLMDQLRAGHPGGMKAWDEALHRSDFAAVQAGLHWVLRPLEAAPTKTADSAAVLLPSSLGACLAQLNTKQRAHDQAQRDLAAQRDQLFADWTLHLADKHAVQRTVADAEPFDGRRNIGRARLVSGMHAVSQAERAATRAQRGRDDAQRALLDAQKRWPPGAGYELQSTAGPRYWKPTDPVLLLWGADVQPPPAFDNQALWQSGGWRDSMEAQVTPSAKPQPFNTTPWRPVMLAWQVEYLEDLPLGHAQTYPPNYLVEQCTQHDSDINQQVQRAAPSAGGTNRTGAASGTASSVANPVKTICGLVPLTAAPTTSLINQGQRYLASFAASAEDADQQVLAATLKQTLQALATAPIQSQALSGFNDALLGRRQALELPVMDPHAAHSDEFAFGFEVQRAVAEGNARGCVPFDLFNPLRAGQLRVRRLWLIDSFGRALPVLGQPSDDADNSAESADGASSAIGSNSDKHLDTSKRLRPEQLIRAQALVPPADDKPDLCSLHPRLLAPARLALRWCSAADHQVDADHDSANQPLIGWLLPEHLDNRLALYSADGLAIGSLNIDGALWCGAPGPNFERSPQQVLPAGPLLHLIEGLITLVENAGSRAPLQAFLDAVDDMTQNILPNQHEQHAGLALLMGSPLAIVRATVALELAVPPPRDQRIAAFVSPLDGPPRSDGGLAALRVPVKLGHRQHLDDGLVGYFVGASEVMETYGAFYMEPGVAASQRNQNREPVTFASPVVAAARDSLTVSVNGAPVLLTMLIDPRAPVHAATGILPTKAIELPPAVYAKALSRLAVSFPVSALLGPRGPASATASRPASDADAAFPVPTPEEPGFEWHFTHRAGPLWPQRAVVPVPSAATMLTQAHDVFDGWLLLQPVDDADGATGDEGNKP